MEFISNILLKEINTEEIKNDEISNGKDPIEKIEDLFDNLQISPIKQAEEILGTGELSYLDSSSLSVLQESSDISVQLLITSPSKDKSPKKGSIPSFLSWKGYNKPNVQILSNESIQLYQKQFKAAGIIFYHKIPGTDKLQILLGTEYRTSEGQVLHLLGGKIEKSESSDETAKREFREESGFLLSESQMDSLFMPTGNLGIWYGPGKYILYFVPSTKETEMLPKLYNNLDQSNLDASSEMNELMWISWNSLVHCINHRLKLRYGEKRLKISRFLGEILGHQVILDFIRLNLLNST